MSEHDILPVRFELLGPLRAWKGTDALALGPVQQQIVLSVLLLNANRPVSRTAMIDAVWGEAVPACAVNLIQRHVSGLRRALGSRLPPGSATRQPVWTEAGYLLTVAPNASDLSMFERQLSKARRARTAGDIGGAAKALHSALQVWRGAVCDGLSSPLLDAERARLAELRISIVEERVELDLLVGANADLIAELRKLIAEYPLRERLRGLLMRLLYGTGRQAEALAAFHTTRRTLLDELGVEPSRELLDLHQMMLRGDPSLAPARDSSVIAPVPSNESRAVAPEPPRPAQLPSTIPQFTAREEELDYLNAVIRDGNGRIVLIVGTAGVGKTALALHWTHQVRQQFPDGQLYVNLRGFGPAGIAMEPSEALQGFLEALGVPSDQVPASVGQQSALYRTLLQDRQVLVLLDNARSVEQVRPLLPGSAASHVVVTSRNMLSGLITAAGAHPLRLDVLPPRLSRQLLAGRLGPDRVQAEPRAVDEIVRVCAGLPLALATVAARGAAQPRFALAAIAEQLRASTDALEAFADDDELTDVRAVFSWSYDLLDAESARLFRLMALHAGPDMAIPAAACLLGESPASARSAMTVLARTHLVEEFSPGRFGFHDLMRAYASEQAMRVESEADRRQALHRVLTHYLCTAVKADRLISPARVPLTSIPIVAGVMSVDLTDRQQALAWFATELPALYATVDHRPGSGLDDLTWDLIWGLETFLDRRGQWRERRYGEAYTRYTQALRKAQEQRDRIEQARLHIRLNWVLERLGRFLDGLAHAHHALDLFTRLDHRAGVAQSKNAIGWCHAKLGDYEQALSWCGAALRLSQELGERNNEAHAWDSLGYAHHMLGAYQEAIRCYESAVDLWRELGVRNYEAETLNRLSDVREADGDPETANTIRRSAELIRTDMAAHRSP